MIVKIYNKCRDFSKQMQKDNIGAYAASMAFFFILSIVPILLIACSILTHIPLSAQMILKVVNEYMPHFLDSTLNDVWIQVNYSYGKILPIAIVVLLWSAGKAMWGLMMGLNASNHVVESRNIILVRLKASFYSLVMLGVIIACMCMIVLSESVGRKLYIIMPGFSNFLLYFANVRFVIVWFVMTVVLTVIYTVVPNKKLKFRYQIPGALISSIGWAAFSWGFSVYVENYSSYNVYGSLSTIIFIMMWMYICMYLLLIGANINRYFEKIIIRVMSAKLINRKKNVEEAIHGQECMERCKTEEG